MSEAIDKRTERTVVAITGASSGIGAEFARRLAAGHDLILIARRRDRLETLAEELSGSYGSQIEILEADLTVERDLETAAIRLKSEKRLALLVNNAGFGTRGVFWEASLESQEQMHKLHVMATVRLTHAALKGMVQRDFGGIINVASVAAFVRSAGSASYCATKSWMTVFTETLHLELKSRRSNVIVQALCPGFTYSEFHQTMGVKRERLASPAFWLTAGQVVEASLDGLRRRKLFVIPGWRYRVLTALIAAVPSRLRVAIEAAGTRLRGPERITTAGDRTPAIGDRKE